MGIYLDHKQTSGLTWLAMHATPAKDLSKVYPWDLASGEVLLAHVVNSQNWDPVAIMFNKTELKRWQQGRPDARFYVAPISEVRKVSTWSPDI